MAKKFENQVALVTGAASGIGHSYTKFLLQNGFKVALCDVNLENCQSVAGKFSKEFGHGKTLALCCDVTDSKKFENAFKLCISHFKRLDVVINNAGVFNESMENWNTTMNINYVSVVRGTMLAIKYMGTPYFGKGGTVVQTASIAAFVTNYYVAPMYRSTKRAVVEYTRAIGNENAFKHFNVRVMALCPGYVNTPFIQGDRTHLYLIDEFAKVAKDTMNYYPIQTPDNVGKALIDILQRGKTGDCWVVENEEPPRLANIPNIPY